MKVVSIFAGRLYAFHFDSEQENELKRLLNLWSDTSYLYQFIKQNIKDAPKGSTIGNLVIQVSSDADIIDDLLVDKNLEFFFKQLDNREYQFQLLSKRKGRKNYLRIYALKIDENLFVITGGAIKFNHRMEDREHTKTELQKIESCREFLKANGVQDADSFYDYLNETI